MHLIKEFETDEARTENVRGKKRECKGKQTNLQYRWGFQHSFLVIYRTGKQKSNKKIQHLNISNKPDPITIYKSTPHKSHRIYTLSKCTQSFTKIDRILGHKTTLNKLRRTEVIRSMSSDHKVSKLEINNRVVLGKSPNIWQWNDTLLNNPCINEEITREIGKHITLNENETLTQQSVGCSQSSA